MTVHTGIWKEPVAGSRMVRRLDIDGDGQGDLQGHGGEQRAVLVYLLLSDSERLAAAAAEAGVDVTLEVGQGLPHVYQLLLGMRLV